MKIKQEAKNACAEESAAFSDKLMAQAIKLSQDCNCNFVGEVHIRRMARYREDLLWAAEEAVQGLRNFPDRSKGRLAEIGKLFVDFVETDQGR